MPAGAGRGPGRDWWCGDAACLRVRDRVRQRAMRARRPKAPRVAVVRERPAPRTAEVCEGCGGPYWRTPGRNSPDSLCSKPACQRERRRRLKRRLAPRTRVEVVRPCGACGEPVPRGNRRMDTTWWCATVACRREYQRQKNAAAWARRNHSRGGGVDVAVVVAEGAAKRVRRYAADPAEAAEILAMLGLDPAAGT
ncbi:hypothetical protein [Frankia sp. AvcI1]|uniref:hypothetical protein n=1 Tax=Frankia sp. AvcI1 TaxID=573496 RepID=UPI0021198118|nr:hypothetical protein [Frankia sp. AvcI1]